MEEMVSRRGIKRQWNVNSSTCHGRNDMRKENRKNGITYHLLVQEMEFIVSLRDMKRHGWTINSNTCHVLTKYKVRVRYMHVCTWSN